jgi:hypothetical protein
VAAPRNPGRRWRTGFGWGVVGGLEPPSRAAPMASRTGGVILAALLCNLVLPREVFWHRGRMLRMREDR